MIVCPTCGNENPAGSRFCSNCGTALTTAEPAPSTGASDPASPAPAPGADAPSVAATEAVAESGSGTNVGSPAKAVPPMPEPRPWAPQPSIASSPSSALPATAPEWRMSDAGPLLPPRGRRRWLWILVGILGACLLLCVGLTIWGNTDSGTRVLNDLATSLAEAATPAAGTSTAGE